jgi:uncharacterized membrane protein YkoI
MNLRCGTLLVLWLSVCGAAGGTVYAAPVEASADRSTVSMDQAVKMAEQRFHARVIKAETQQDGGRTVYILKLLNDSSGRVWTVHVDAANGTII